MILLLIVDQNVRIHLFIFLVTSEVVANNISVVIKVVIRVVCLLSSIIGVQIVFNRDILRIQVSEL